MEKTDSRTMQKSPTRKGGRQFRAIFSKTLTNLAQQAELQLAVVLDLRENTKVVSRLTTGDRPVAERILLDILAQEGYRRSPLSG